MRLHENLYKEVAGLPHYRLADCCLRWVGSVLARVVDKRERGHGELKVCICP